MWENQCKSIMAGGQVTQRMPILDPGSVTSEAHVQDSYVTGLLSGDRRALTIHICHILKYGKAMKKAFSHVLYICFQRTSKNPILPLRYF